MHWQAGPALAVGGLTLLPIEQILWHTHTGRHGGWVTVSKQPVAIVVRDPVRWQAMSADGSAMSIDELRERVPDLDAALAVA